MNIEQMIGSIKGYFYNQWNVACLDKQIPIEVPIPSMFFPSPRTVASVDTKFSYSNTYLINVKLFHNSSAEAIAQSIRESKESIAILNIDGTETTEKLIFDKVESEINDTGVAQILLQWKYKFDYK